MARSIVYNEDNINEIGKRLNQLEQKSKDCSDKMTNNYSGYTSHGILSETVTDLNKNFNSLESIVSSTANSFVKHGTEMMDFDRKVALEIDGTYVSQDFVGNNAIEINYYNASILSKIDGKSVKEGKDAKESEYDDSTVIAGEDLFNMNKNKETSEKEYDETSIVGKSILGSVNGGETDQRDIDDSTSIGNVKLKNINESQTNEKEYNDSVAINNVGLNNISGGTTVEQDFDDSTVIGESILGNINSSKKEVEEKNIDDFLAEFKNNKKEEQTNNNEEIDNNVSDNNETGKDE